MSLTFEERYTEIDSWIEKRRYKWTLSSTSFDDIKQIVLIRIYKKYHLYDETKKDKHGNPVEFKKWVNKVISNAIRGALRDLHFKWSRPCLGGCPFNTGGDSCSQTRSGKQCDECPIYRKWRVRKESHFAVMQTLPAENHFNEINNIQSDFLDIDRAKKIIDRKMREELTKHEYKIYRHLFMQGKTIEETGQLMGYKQRRGSKTCGGYQCLLRAKHRIVEMAKKIIAEEGLAEPI